MTRFETCVDFVLRMEGGYVNDPDDPGGATNMGITQHELNSWRNSRGEPTYGVRDLQRSEAEAIYHAWYWDRLNCDSIPEPLDLALFDYGVNSGVVRAIHALQSCAPTDSVTRAIQLCAQRESFYRSIVDARPVMKKFLDADWLPRIAALRREIFAAHTPEVKPKVQTT